MSAYATSSPSRLQIRWYLIRPPSLACTCRNEMSLFSVAEYSFTGTLTSPKETAPFQIARMGPALPLIGPGATSLCAHRVLTTSAEQPHSARRHAPVHA